MTFTEARDILDQRVNWRDNLNILSVDNTTSESGRYFQDEHSAITLENIKACQPEVNISNSDFNNLLVQLRSSAILRVLADVYGAENTITQNELDCNVGVFDTAISLRMTIIVAEMIITSVRSNRIERISKDFIQQLHFDVNGNYGQNLNPNFPRVEGFGKRYQDEIKNLKRFLNKQSRFKTITTGIL